MNPEKKMKCYIVGTASGDFETMAVSEAKAISNIQFRLKQRTGSRPNPKYWTVKERNAK